MTDKQMSDKQSRVEQINERRRETRQNNIENVSGIFILSEVERLSRKLTDSSPLYNAMAFLCALCRISIVDYNKLSQVCGADFSPQDIARLSGFLCRKVSIDSKWKGPDLGASLICFGDGEHGPVVCLRRHGILICWDAKTKKTVPLTEITGRIGETVCYSIGRALPSGVVTWKDIIRFSLAELRFSDGITMGIGTLLSTYAGLKMATLNELLFGRAIPFGQDQFLVYIAVYIISCMIGGVLFSTATALSNYRFSSRVRYALQSALYDRLFHLRESYFRTKESAVIAYRLESTLSIYTSAFSSAVTVLETLVFSVMYITKMATYSPALTGIGVAFILLGSALTVGIGFVFQKYQMEKAAVGGQLRSILFQTLSMMQSVRLNGAADEFHNHYLEKYSRYGELQLRNEKTQRLSNIVVSATGCLVILFSYLLMAQGRLGINVSMLLAFLAAFGAYAGAMSGLSQNLLQLIISMPILKNSSEILRENPENGVAGIIPDKLTGQIRIANVSFSYDKGEPPVLRNISMNIESGAYIGIVGASGSGKSTLLRLLLGFEQPGTGRIYYDNTDLSRMNPVEFRRRIGTVLQDGVLFSGTILDNIRICRPQATMEEVFAAAELADIREDIEKMPLGFLTPVSEQAHTLSGGQKQRIMIARAVLSRPSILLMDEATSALDNVSQKKICDALSELHCTRIVVAHRLSTVEQCDQIVVLEGGTVVEVGTCSELMEKKGTFYRLAQNQLR